MSKFGFNVAKTAYDWVLPIHGEIMMRPFHLLLGAALLASSLATTAAPVPVYVAKALADAQRPPTDIARDDARKPGAMIDFAHIKPGAKVADLIPGHGYFTRVFAVAVKPGGSVVAIVPATAAQHDPDGAAAINAIAADKAYGNVSVVDRIGNPALAGLDVFWTAQNYHDLHNALPPEQLAAANKAIFAALKPGGYYVIIDHAAAAGSGVSATNTLHRIDPEVVKAEVTAAGFVLDGSSDVLANPADPHTANVFDPSIRGKTDQFAFRFKKPG
jgi:predicted methyltransferase